MLLDVVVEILRHEHDVVDAEVTVVRAHVRFTRGAAVDTNIRSIRCLCDVADTCAVIAEGECEVAHIDGVDLRDVALEQRFRTHLQYLLLGLTLQVVVTHGNLHDVRTHIVGVSAGVDVLRNEANINRIRCRAHLREVEDGLGVRSRS